MNLAAWKYRNIFKSNEGPIERVSEAQIKLPDGSDGFQVMAYLRPELQTYKVEKLVYGDCDGTGTDKYRHVALHKAISEALERWAFYENMNNDRAQSSAYGFDKDPTTNGMSAFPGFGKGTARESSRLEAIERWSLLKWWDQGLPVREVAGIMESKAFRILSPWDNVSVVLVYRKCQGFATYGFAAAKTVSAAIWRAEVERARNESVMSDYLSQKGNLSTSGALGSEKRLLRFAQEEHFQFFLEHMRMTCSQESGLSLPKTLIDCELPGAWSKYATVWRVMFDLPTEHYLESDDFFFF